MEASKLLDLIQQRPAGHALDRQLYIGEDVYVHDLEHIWHKEWIFAGHTFEVQAPGSYMTLQLGDFPVVIIRGDDGELRAFHNVCRHRGSRLCTATKGKSAKLVCPYHKWTYGLDGNLIFAPSMEEGFQRDGFGLFPAHCEVVDSYIYVCVAEHAPDFEAFRRDIFPFIQPHDLANCKVAYEETQIESGNWKLVFENNRECYHCESHPELSVGYIENLAIAGIVDEEDTSMAEHCQKCESAGLPCQVVIDDRGQYRMTRVPLVEGVKSFTMDGKEAVKNHRLDSSGVDHIGSLLYFHYPSTWNHVLGDHALSFRLLPINASQTQLTTKWLVHKDAVEGVDYDIEHLTHVWKATNAQDRQLVEETHRGVSSPTFVPGPYSDLVEKGPRQFVDWYCLFMAERLEKAIKKIA